MQVSIFVMDEVKSTFLETNNEDTVSQETITYILLFFLNKTKTQKTIIATLMIEMLLFIGQMYSSTL